jgi:lipoyl(octanoyl) transferase
VVDHFDFSREVVSISISFLDRYLSVRAVDKRLFQLAAMTSLYMTIKIYERGTLSMASMIDLSRGFFMVEHMAAMEWGLFE